MWNRAMQQRAAGQLSQAVATVRMHLKVKPRDAHALHLLATMQMEAGDPQAAAVSAERALALLPGQPDFSATLASCLARLGRFEQAIALWEGLLAGQPDHAPTLSALAAAYAMVGQAERGVAVGRRAVELMPGVPHAVGNLAIALTAAGRTEETEQALRAGVLQAPDDRFLRATLLMQMHYRMQDPAEMLEAHRTFGRMVPAPRPPAIVDPDPARPLRVGIVSPDLCRSSVANFLLAALQPPAGVTLVAFATAAHHEGDPVNARLKSLVHEWVDAFRLPGGDLDACIRQRRIDVLLELAGHVGESPLASLAAKPAPVIVTAIGYPGTTGVPAVDWRLVDSITDPPGSEHACTERLLRLDPCFLCYAPPEEAPEIRSPAEATPFTFGSFNNHQKISPETLQLWAAALQAVPGSKLLLKSSLAARSSREQGRDAHLLQRMDESGIDRSRIELHPHVATQGDHLHLYGRMHVALDTTPYNGTTTTCEALWMGVPVITTLGDRHASRVSASLLHAAGHPEWVAKDVADFTRIARDLAADRPRLAALRASLRAQVQASTLCDAAAYGERFHKAIRTCWARACGAANGS
jgi:predicted O-linked N-acetylglucosamine transferase (SPINDLY family)